MTDTTPKQSMPPRFGRRSFLTRAGLGGAAAAAGATLAAPAIASENPKITWRMASSFPKSLDTLYGGGETLSKWLSEATDGNFTIQLFAAGEIVPGLDAINAAAAGTVESAHSASYYNWGKNSAYACGTDLPFTLNARARTAYNYYGGGIELFNEFLATEGLVGRPGGNTGAQMGGWYRKEIKTLADLKGLKMRISGLAGRVMERLGVVPQQLAGGDIYPALEKGTLDAVEFVGPYDDAKLGFVKVAPYYYYPGFWEGGPTIGFFFNKEQYENLPASYRSLLDTVCRAVDQSILAHYDYVNPPALKEVVAQGAKLSQFSEEIMMAAFDASRQVYSELAAENEWFKKLYEAMQPYMDDWFFYQSGPEYRFDSFMLYMQSQGKLASHKG